MLKVMNSIHAGLPAGLEELAQLGRTLWRRRRDVVAYFDIGASNGPVEAINGRLEHLCGIALGFKKHGPLYLAVSYPLRRPTRKDQRTPKREEQVKLPNAP
ncbi:Transposase [Corynebacterium epidermidicanis]|uniref:Transposase n=1 Tax=Corynebacterium epidermidicanis TaxID=1050174 RepID=A0A0G3GLA7_9CORY|nr:Transposase [Corynebacterium epidermidicanis]